MEEEGVGGAPAECRACPQAWGEENMGHWGEL